MRERLIAKGASPERISVIPNWVDTTSIVARAAVRTIGRAAELVDKFTVMHSGKRRARPEPRQPRSRGNAATGSRRPRVPIVGSAPPCRDRELARALEADKVLSCRTNRARCCRSRSARAHVHYVGLAKACRASSSRAASTAILAAGRPVIVAADPDSETSRLVEEAGCGVALPPDRPDLLARAIRDAYDGRLDLEQMGARGREYVVREADRSIALARYRALIVELARPREDPPGDAVLRPGVGIRRPTARDVRLRRRARGARARRRRLHHRRPRRAQRATPSLETIDGAPVRRFPNV